MATAKIYLDKRKAKADGTFPLRITISHRGATARMTLGIAIRADQWNATTSKVTNHPNKDFINPFLLQKLTAVSNALLTLQERGELKSCSATEVRDKVLAYLNPEDTESVTFCNQFKKFTALHENRRTRELYEATWRQVERYDGNAARLTFDDITREWLEGLYTSMAAHSPSINARNIHLRNIRAVFNHAIDNGLTDRYPFRRMKIRPVATPKRNLQPVTLRALFDAEVEPWRKKYIDLFKLSFLLIGINVGDLLDLPPDAIRGGRISFNRKKTHRLYSIKVEPEARELIDRYRGERHLLNLADRCKTYRSVAAKANASLSHVIPGVTTYWARHSWATIAASLDIPDDTIALALGHSGANATTSIYIERDLRKVDAANRRVIDFVLYGRK